MNSQEQKACLIENHESSFITSICLDKQCKIGTRTICQDCLFDPNYYHKDCQVFLKFIGQSFEKLKLHYSKSYDMKQTYQEILKFEEESIDFVDSEFDRLADQIVKKLTIMRKEMKINVLEKYSKVKQDIKDSLDWLESFENLEDLNEKMKQFKEQSLSIEQLNESLAEKSKLTTNIIEIQNEYQKIDKKILPDDYFPKMQENILKYLQQQSNFNLNNNNPLPSNGNNNSNNSNSNSNTNTNTNNTSNINNNTNNELIKFVPFRGFENVLNLINGTEIKCLGRQGTMRSVNKFKVDQHIKFSFKINFERPVDDVFIGMFPANKLPENNNPITGCQLINFVGLRNNMQKVQLRKTTQKSLSMVYRNGQIYDVEIKFTENIFKISDRAKEAVLENQHQFNLQFQEWYLFLQQSFGTVVKLLPPNE